MRHVPREEFKELADHRIIPVGESFVFRDHDGTVGEPPKHNLVTLAKGEHLAIRLSDSKLFHEIEAEKEQGDEQ